MLNDPFPSQAAAAKNEKRTPKIRTRRANAQTIAVRHTYRISVLSLKYLMDEIK